MDAINAERSKLIQTQKQKRADLEKKVKKLKGAMKEAAQKELDEFDDKAEAELAEFDKSKGVGGKDGSAASSKATTAKEEPHIDASKFHDRNWSGLSKKELEEECVERGLGKKGSKEDLVQKLIIFHQDLQSKAAAAGPAPAAAKDDDDDDDEEEDDDDDDEDDEDDDDDAEDVSPEEMEKQGKREKVVQKALKFLLVEKCKEGFKLDELVEKLGLVNVKGFTPEKLGYKTIEKFVKGQPESVLRYSKKTQLIKPPR